MSVARSEGAEEKARADVLLNDEVLVSDVRQVRHIERMECCDILVVDVALIRIAVG